MKEGYVILIIIALIFMGIFIFSRLYVKRERLKAERLENEMKEAEALLELEKEKRENAILKKWKRVEVRRNEIKEQLEWLKQINKEINKKTS